MADRQAWFCPACQKHHAPHVETCPGPADAISDKCIPAVRTWGTPPVYDGKTYTTTPFDYDGWVTVVGAAQ